MKKYILLFTLLIGLINSISSMEHPKSDLHEFLKLVKFN